ncbi:MAG: hypothetical protein UX09_C0012G0011 [Candidatus Uhrbacteria bacterium GW2011_GWE2_45_35]|uniref:phosphoglycerate mutase (2,3-diphosphoglycerate-dependent) n=2 Tax=Candidatus Uhriibacteriota TaxID=1752732 RepID=A0A0G1LRU0_9BACT|nr:MAG: hypothetical protein UW63_C0013G0008 [Candidatus Uhrbacteria bacterium GW2011_GWF2_44_350]KKU08798.1 MAG: hypothetical protein UX09_C0012G0011 [Candidatus Uhrbacteria bacterium GW2011_GWE2_45_35]HBR80670.1 hypothetical protein [Candidatus Uhrbacteria bacterium]HCU31146.1 hypothetical protein [Candidatus Uhrbacteria bacterium]
MTMPLHLVLVRHGESEGNIAQKQVKQGDDRLMRELDRVHTEAWRLSALGRWQAETIGPWLRQEFSEGFTRYLTSWYVRAMETACLLDLPEADWFPHPMLSERNWGQLSSATIEQRNSGSLSMDLARQKRDGVWWSPAGGESIAGILPRLHTLLDSFHREQSAGTVIAVCHGEVMWGTRILLERLTPWQFRALDESNRPHDRIHNCQVIHYSRVNPVVPDDVRTRLSWMRSVCPWDTTLSSNEWRLIERPRFNNKQLREIVAHYQRFLPDNE